jgi:ATP-dependent Clp protease ATP-binding subunit ClpA
MLERFTKDARATVMRARKEAQSRKQRDIGTEHLLLALVDPDSGTAYRVLRDAGLTADGVAAEVDRRAKREFGAEDAAALATIGIDLDDVLRRIEESFGPEALEKAMPARPTGWFRGGVGVFTPGAKKSIALALREAVHLGDPFIGSEHLLLGLIREGNGMATAILVDAGLDLKSLRAAAIAARS